MSVVVVATIIPKPGQLGAIQAAFEDIIQAVQDEDGCELYALHVNADRLVMIEKWSSHDALNAHAKGHNLQVHGARIGDLVDAPIDVVRLEAVPAGYPGKGAL